MNTALVRSAALWVVALALLLPSRVMASAGSQPPSSDNLHAFALGQSYVRSFEDYLEPGSCGIVLERQRCRDDFAAIRQFAGPRKMDDEVTAWLRHGDVDQRVTDWDGLYIPDDTWKNDPTFAWWYTAGALSIAANMPKNDGTSPFLSSIEDVLAAHDSAAPTGFSNAMGTNGSPFDKAKGLLDLLDAAIPPVPYPAVSDAAGATGEAQLGVLNSTALELFDNPLALSRPESRAFALAVIDKDEALDRKFGGSYSFDTLRRALRGDIPEDNGTIDSLLRQPWVAWVSDLKNATSDRDAFLLGDLTAQAAYNAAVLKDKNADSTYLRGAIAQIKPYEGMTSAALTAVGAMQNVPYGVWGEINPSATAATLAIIGP